MDGLIKGLMDVALGALDRERDDDRSAGHRDQVRDRDHGNEERSGSTWAEVVSGEPEEDEGGRGRNRRRQQGQDSWNDQHEEGWEGQGSRLARRPATDVNEVYRTDGGGRRHDYEPSPWNRKEEIQDQSEGWETVKRPPKHHKVRMDHWQGYKRPLSEQEYSEDVQIGSETEPTHEELSALSLACNKLWDLDLNRLVPGRDFRIDCGEGKKVYGRDDVAEGSLYSWLSEDVLRRPTYSRFCSLLDNYNPHEGSKEVVTSEEKQEQVAFVEEISRTAPIKYLHRYLSLKGIISDDYGEFKRMLVRLWFELYGRGGTSGSSSAFEHVFVGEIKQRGDEEVSGFHNWLQFYLEEAKGRVDYQGYIFPRHRGELPDAETQLLTIQFKWNGVLKAVSSTLIGVSPEFEVALYTLCFFVGRDDNHVQLGPYRVNIKCYRLGDRIGTAFPQSEC